MARNPKPIRQFKKRTNIALRKSKPARYTPEQLAALKVAIRQYGIEGAIRTIHQLPGSIEPRLPKPKAWT